ncbi:MAG: hypothetical protein HQL64_04405 [Magnetococcales bacterium]|nr:hypothetical protein [Magnetococcales bacterium]
MKCLFNKYAVVFLGAFLLGGSVFATAMGGGLSYEIQLGVKMFPTLVGSNLDIEKQKNQDGELSLLIIYQDDFKAGQQVNDILTNTTKTIVKSPVRIRLAAVSELGSIVDPVAGAFIAEQLSSVLRFEVIRFATQKRAVVFSPFAGDVEGGIMTGIHVATQVQPALNNRVIHASGMRLNQILFKVAKVYE